MILLVACVVGAPLAFAQTTTFSDAWSRHTVTGYPDEREFHVYIPPTLNDSTASGVVLFLHGWSMTAAQACVEAAEHDYAWNVVATADAHKFVAICPQGRGESGNQGWNNEICCGGHEDADDVGFMRALLKKLRDEILVAEGITFDWGIRASHVTQVRPNVLAVGFSTGGLFSYRLGCELTDEITGIAPTGATWNHAFMLPGVMTWAVNCASSVQNMASTAQNGSYGFPSLYQSIGDEDFFTSEDLALSRWDAFSTDATLLDCDANARSTTLPVVLSEETVTCQEYRPGTCSDGNTNLGSKLCIYSPLGHTVDAMESQFDYGSAEQAWLYLSWVNGLSTSTTLAADSQTQGTASPTPDTPVSTGTPTPARVGIWTWSIWITVLFFATSE